MIAFLAGFILGAIVGCVGMFAVACANMDKPYQKEQNQ